MRTKLLIFAAAIVFSFAFIGCKGGNTPDDPSESNPKYTYDASTRKYEVTMNDGQKLYFAVVALEIREGVATKLDTALTLISYPNYMRGDDKSKTDEEPYLPEERAHPFRNKSRFLKFTRHRLVNAEFRGDAEQYLVDLVFDKLL